MTEDLPEVGPWARDKLARLAKYLNAYTRIMSNQSWAKYVYVDAFAGSGRANVRQDDADDPLSALMDLGEKFRLDAEVREVLDGSPRIALDVTPPFTQYVFLERDPKRLNALRALQKEYAGRRNVVVREGDCNEYLIERLANNPKIDWRTWRAVVFLDPFGMQVPWKTVYALSRTHAVEVFLNLPVGMAIQRSLRRDGNFSDKARKRLDEYFGDSGWFDIVYPPIKGLFGLVPLKAPDAGQRLVSWYSHRLKEIFGNVSRPYLVRNSHRSHLYFLIFAGHNKTGAKIANDILTSGAKA